MRLQLIHSEASKLPDPLEELKDVFKQVEVIQVVSSVEDVMALNKLSADIGKDLALLNYESININSVTAKTRLAKTYFDPNSAHDNFI